MKSHAKRVPAKGKINLQNFEKSYQLAEIKAVYKTERIGSKTINCSRAAYQVFYDLYDPDTIGFQEEVFMLLLNRVNNVIGWVKVSTGGTSGAIIDSKVIFPLALQTNAHGFMLSHNHPSGNLKPSESDRQLTNKLKQGAMILGITFYDHLIIAPENGYFSFADEGLM